MSDSLRRLNAIAKKSPNNWREKAQYLSDNECWLKECIALAIDLNRYLGDHDLSKYVLCDILQETELTIDLIVKGRKELSNDQIEKIKRLIYD